MSTALHASEILDAMDAAPTNVGANSSATAHLKAAQWLTQQLAGVSPTSDLYRQVMGDPRTAVLENAAFGDITGAQGSDTRATLNAEGAALSGYRNTVLFPALVHDTLGSSTTQHTLQAVGAPENLNDIANVLDPLAQTSPELAQALFTQMQGNIEALIGKGPEVIAQVAPSGPLPGGDAYYAPLARIIDDAGGPKSTATQPVVDALRKQLQHQQAQIDEGGTEALDSTFQPLASPPAPGSHHSTAVYQALIDEAPSSELAKTLEKYTRLKPQSESAAASVSPADASALAQAETALEGHLGGGPVNADTLQAALAAAMGDKGDDGKLVNANIGGTTWAQAAIVAQLRADGQTNAGSDAQAQQGDAIERASAELSGDQLFDADTLDAATSALKGGKLADGTVPLTQQQLPSASGGSAADYMGSLVSEGVTMPEAIALTRAWLGGRSASEPALVQAALEVSAEQPDIMQQFYDDSSKDPIRLAAQKLKAMDKTLGAGAPDATNVLDPKLIDQLVDGTPAADGKPAVPGMAQDIKPDLAALDDANGKPGLISQAQSAYDAWQSAQAKADANQNDSNAQSAARTALTRYHAALSAALNAAAGRKPGDDASWQADDSNIDTLWKARLQLQKMALAPQMQAAQDAGDDAPESQALDAALQQWQTGFDALRVIARARANQQQAQAQAGGDAGAGSLGAAKSLAQLDGLPTDDPLYRQVMGDEFVATVKGSALASITGEAQPFMPCASGDDAAALKARFHGEATRLQQYQSTAIYAQLMDDVASDPATQQLFSRIRDEVQWRKNDSDKLATLADVLEGSGSTDLSARFVHQMFATGGAKPGFSPDQLVAWTRNANDLKQIARIYQAAGAAQNQDMTDLRHALETMVTSGDPKFGGTSGSSGLNKRTVNGKTGVRVWGEDLGFGDLQKHYVQMQLAQDMLDDDATNALGREIARETGYKDEGKPAAGVSASAPGESALTSDAEYSQGASVAVSTGGNLVGLQLSDGMQTFSSDDALLNASGAAYGLTVAHTPTTLAEEQALSDGTFALYDPNQTVFDASGRKTTLGQVVASLKHGSGADTASALTPVTMGSLSGEWWNTRTPGKDQQGTSFTLLEGISAGGDLIDVGPADPTARQGYARWQSHTGFAKGFMTVQPHWVVNAQGEDLTDSAYFTSYKPDMSWWERWGSVVQIAGTVAAGILTVAAPEAAPLWLALAADGADAYFAATAAMGTMRALQRLSKAQGADDWVNWLNLAANMSGAAASGLGAISRAAAIGDRVGSRASAYADVARVTSETDPALAGAGATRVTTAFSGTMPAWRDAALLKLLGKAALVTNGVSMGQQTEALVQAALEGKPISAQDWLGLASSTALSLVGVGVGRARGNGDDEASLSAPAVDDVSPPAASAPSGGQPLRYQIPGDTKANSAELAALLSVLLRSEANIDGVTYVVYQSPLYDPAETGLVDAREGDPATDYRLALDDALPPARYDTIDAARLVAGESYGIAIVDSRALGVAGSVPPEAVIATIGPEGVLSLEGKKIDINPRYRPPNGSYPGYAYPRHGRASTRPPIEIDEATGGWLPPADLYRARVMSEFIAGLLNSGGRLAGKRYAVYGANGNRDTVNSPAGQATDVEFFDDLDMLVPVAGAAPQRLPEGGRTGGVNEAQPAPTVAIVDDSGSVVATLLRDDVRNEWVARFNNSYVGKVPVAYPDGFVPGQLIRGVNGERIDTINAPAFDGGTQLASFPRREPDLALYNFGKDFPENRLLGGGKSGKPKPLLVPAPPGYFIVLQHAGTRGFINRMGAPVSSDQVAAEIIGAGWDGRQPILFYSCGPGAQIDKYGINIVDDLGDQSADEGTVARSVVENLLLQGYVPRRAPVAQEVIDALKTLYPVMRGEKIDPSVHVIAANSPIESILSFRYEQLGGYTMDVRVVPESEWGNGAEMSSWLADKTLIVGAKDLRFSVFYPSLEIFKE
ncbi:MAG: hypothetical protein ACTHK5_10235 [Tsuneonella sp.]